jgi:hypothetical protein
LIVGPVEDNERYSLFDLFPWQINRAPTCLDFITYAYWTLPRVVICERDLPDGSWKDVLAITMSLHNPPPVTVTSRLANDYVWAEVLNWGGYDLLAKPLDQCELNRSIQPAWERSARLS